MEISALNQDGGFSRQGVQAIRSLIMEVLAEEGLLGKPQEPEVNHVPPTPASTLNDKYALRQEIQAVLGEQPAVNPGVSEERVMELLDARTRVLNTSGRLSAIPGNRFLTH
jgi:hypothetical protein